MNNFIPKRLPTQETLGEKLRQARLNKNFQLEDLSKFLGIRREYLEALEENRYDLLPAGLYSKSFLKKYGLKLGFQTKDLKIELDSLPADTVPDDPFSQKVVKKKNFIIFPRLIRYFLIATAVIACLLYLAFYAKKITTPPTLIISQPEKNVLTSETSYTVVGLTEPEAEIRINEAIILNNNQGSFSQTINLKRGINTLVITAKKKYSRPNQAVRQILVE